MNTPRGYKNPEKALKKEVSPRQLKKARKAVTRQKKAYEERLKNELPNEELPTNP